MTAARALAGLGADALLTSPMRRARQTADVLSAELGLEPLVDPDVHEVRESSDFAALGPEEQRLKRWSEWMAEHAEDPDWAPPGAESFNAVRDRVARVKARLEGRDPEAAVLVVSHGIFMRFFLVDSLLADEFRAGEARRLWQLRTSNCGMSTFEHGSDGWTCLSWMCSPGTAGGGGRR
jgi:probable phosphoglycerate mutase